MRSYTLLVVLALVATALPAIEAAAPLTYVVCASGCPFGTIQLAASKAHPGDTILVRPGTYPERVYWDTPGITLRSVGGAAATVIDATLTSDGDHATAIAACGGDALIRGFTIRAGAHVGGGYGVQLCGGDHNRIASNTFDGAWVGVGTVFSSSSHNTVVGNELRGATGWAIGECCGLADNTYEGNFIHDNHHGVYVDGQGSRVTGNRFEHNGPVAVACTGPVDARGNWWGSPLGPVVGTVESAARLDPLDLGGACLDAQVAPWCLSQDCADPLAGLPLPTIP